MARGQSTIEYLLGLAVIVLGLVATLSCRSISRAWQQMYHEVAARVARDHLP